MEVELKRTVLWLFWKLLEASFQILVVQKTADERATSWHEHNSEILEGWSPVPLLTEAKQQILLSKYVRFKCRIICAEQI